MGVNGSRCRLRLKQDYSNKGYKECPLCGTPIRDNLFQDTNGDIKQGRGLIPVKLKNMCEVCWREGDVGGIPVHECSMLPSY